MARSYTKKTNYKKDKKVTILEITTGQDESGYPVEEEAPIKNGENIWAYYRQASGEEFYAAASQNYKVEVVFKIGWRDNLENDMKILFRKVRYAITRIDDYEGYKKDLTIYAYAIN